MDGSSALFLFGIAYYSESLTLRKILKDNIVQDKLRLIINNLMNLNSISLEESNGSIKVLMASVRQSITTC